jgi:hypothetical protein
MHRRQKGGGVRRVAAAVLAAGLLAGCGGGAPVHRAWRTPAPPEPSSTGVSSVADLSADEIVARAIKATQNANSVRVKGKLSAQGQSFGIDMRYDATSGGGRISSETQTVDILRIQRQVWFSGDAKFWRRVGGSRAVKAYRDKYLEIPAAEPRFAPLVDNTYAAKLIHTLVRSKGSFVKQGRTQVRGVAAIEIVDTTKGYGGTIWVAAEGQPYVLKMKAAPHSAVDGAVEFLDYNQRFRLAPPDPKKVIDARELRGDE